MSPRNQHYQKSIHRSFETPTNHRYRVSTSPATSYSTSKKKSAHGTPLSLLKRAAKHAAKRQSLDQSPTRQNQNSINNSQNHSKNQHNCPSLTTTTATPIQQRSQSYQIDDDDDHSSSSLKDCRRTKQLVEGMFERSPSGTFSDDEEGGGSDEDFDLISSSSSSGGSSSGSGRDFRNRGHNHQQQQKQHPKFKMLNELSTTFLVGRSVVLIQSHWRRALAKKRYANEKSETAKLDTAVRRRLTKILSDEKVKKGSGGVGRVGQIANTIEKRIRSQSEQSGVSQGQSQPQPQPQQLHQLQSQNKTLISEVENLTSSLVDMQSSFTAKMNVLSDNDLQELDALKETYEEKIFELEGKLDER